MTPRRIETPVAAIGEAKVILEGQRKPRDIEVRVVLPAEVPVFEAGDAVRAATAHLAAWPAGGDGPRDRAAARVDYLSCAGGLWREAAAEDATSPPAPDAGRETRRIDEATLRAILEARRGAPVPANKLFHGCRELGRAPLPCRGGIMQSLPQSRAQMPTMAEVAASMRIKEIVDDGTASAERQVRTVVGRIALIGGALHWRSTGPVYHVTRTKARKVVAARSPSFIDGALIFSPFRADAAQDLAGRLAGRDRQRVLPREDVIEILEPGLVPNDEAWLVMGHGMAKLWSGSAVGEFLQSLPAADLMRWARLRDLEQAVRSGQRGAAVPAMAAFRDFLDGLSAVRMTPRGEEARKDYLAQVRDARLRIVEVELPRLGVAPGDSMAASDEAALAGLADAFRSAAP